MNNSTFSIAKGLAIIAAVISLADAPAGTTSFFGMIGIPFFFFSSGFFFSSSYLSDARTFAVKRVKRLYIPFVCWSFILLCLHNAFSYVGLAGGGMYTWHSFFQNAWLLVVNMSGYDEATCSTYWFFRSLLLVNFLYWGLTLAFDKIPYLRRHGLTVAAVPAAALLLVLWQTIGGFSMGGVIQGGLRELLGVIFFSFGVAYNRFSSYIPRHWAIGTGSFIILLLFSLIGWGFSLSAGPNVWQSLSLIFTTIPAVLFVLFIADLLEKIDPRISRPFQYLGNHTIYIVGFGALCFKVVNMIKVGFYHLPWQHAADTLTVNYNHGDAFWILYALVGLLLPVGIREFYFYCKRKKPHKLIGNWFRNLKKTIITMIRASMPTDD